MVHTGAITAADGKLIFTDHTFGAAPDTWAAASGTLLG